jgi:hypothetical protein
MVYSWVNFAFMFQLAPVEFLLINYTDLTWKVYVRVLFLDVLKKDQFVLLQQENTQGNSKRLTSGMDHTRMWTQINTNLHGAAPKPRALNGLRMDADRHLHAYEYLMWQTESINLDSELLSYVQSDWVKGRNYFGPLPNKRVSHSQPSTACFLTKNMNICIQSVMLRLSFVPSLRTWKFAYNQSYVTAIMSSDS